MPAVDKCDGGSDKGVPDRFLEIPPRRVRQ